MMEAASIYQTTRRYNPEESLFVFTAVRTSNLTIVHCSNGDFL
jgi:hypothetical protein